MLSTDLDPWDITVAKDKLPDLMGHIFQWGKINNKHANKYFKYECVSKEGNSSVVRN